VFIPTMANGRTTQSRDLTHVLDSTATMFECKKAVVHRTLMIQKNKVTSGTLLKRMDLFTGRFSET